MFFFFFGAANPKLKVFQIQVKTGSVVPCQDGKEQDLNLHILLNVLDKICKNFTSVLLRFGFMLLPELFYSLTRNVFFVHNIIFTTSEYKCVSGS